MLVTYPDIYAAQRHRITSCDIRGRLHIVSVITISIRMLLVVSHRVV